MSNPKSKTAFNILYYICFSHLIIDLTQGVIFSVYPMLKEKYELSYIQIGFITFAFQFSASLLQPLVGYYTDQKPKPYILYFAFTFSLLGILFLAFSTNFTLLIVSCILIGIGSAIFHPESSRIANLASGGKIGVAQSIFQVGGNFGTAIAPLATAFIVLPYSQASVVVFILPMVLSFFILKRIASWHQNYLENHHSTRTIASGGSHIFSRKKIKFILSILLIIIFSKFLYAASLSTYYSFYLIEKFNLTIEMAQTHLFIYLFSYMIGTIIGGPLGDKFGRLFIIWFSVIGATPFILILPYANLLYTDILMVLIGLIMASAFPAIISYAQELLPTRLGIISGLFYGFAFGVAAIGSALIGFLADYKSIFFVYQFCSFLPLIGMICFFLPTLNPKKEIRISSVT